MATAIFRLTTGVVYVRGWSGTLTGSTLALADGAAATPSLTFTSDPTTGLFYTATSRLNFSSAGATRWQMVDDTTKGFQLGSTMPITWSSTTTPGTPDLLLYRDAANILALRNGTNTQIFKTGPAASYLAFEKGNASAGFIYNVDAKDLNFGQNNGSQWKIAATTGHLLAVTDNTYDIGASNATSPRSVYASTSFVKNGGNGGLFSNLQSLTELTTIAAAATTDTTIQMPANAVVLGVSVRVTTVIPTATSFSVGDSGSATRFSTANVSTAANSTDPGTKAGAYYNASALSVRLTMNGGTPAANSGRVRVTIYYYTITPPTS